MSSVLRSSFPVRLLGVMVAVVGLVATMATSAGAATPAFCGSGYFCIWRDTNFVTSGNGNLGIKGQLYIPGLQQWSWPSVGGSANDSTTSEWNNGTGGESVYVYKDKNCSGPSFTATAGNGTGNVGINPGPSTWLNSISSWTFVTQAYKCTRAGT